MESKGKYHKIPWQFIVIFLSLSFVIALSGYFFYQNQKKHIKEEKQNELSAIAELKIKQITNWREERMRDASFIFNHPEIATQIKALQSYAVTSARPVKIPGWMDSMFKNLQYESMCIVSPEGRLIVSISKHTKQFKNTNVRMHLNKALESGEIFFSDLYKNGDKNIFIDIVVPILTYHNNKTSSAGAVILRIDPHEFLYPLIQSWPIPSKTAETLIVRRDGNDALFLNEVRHLKNSALSLRIPISKKEVPAAMAARGETGVIEGIDYRGIPVLAAIKPVPGSLWVMVAKVDMEEVFAPLIFRFRIITLLIIVLIGTAGLSMGLIWRNREAEIYLKEIEERKRSEDALWEKRVQLELAIKASNIGLWDWDMRTNKVYFSPEWKIQIGYGDDELSNDFNEFQSRVHPDDIERILTTLNNYINNLRPDYEVEFRFQHKNGSYRWILARAQIYKDEYGKPYRMIGTHLDITERKQLEHEREKFMHLVDSSTEFIGMCDLDMNPVYVNPAGIQMVGLPDMQAACSVKVQDYFFPEDQDFVRNEFFPRVLREGHSAVEIRLRHFKTGEPIWMFYYLFHVLDANGTPIGWATVSRNITERKKADEELKKYREHLEELVKERTFELEQANIRLQELDRLKSMFIASMSHELRTPLNSIIGFTGILLQGMVGSLNEEQKKQLTIVKNSSRHLLALINDVIDLSKIEAGKVEIITEDFDLSGAIQEVFESFINAAYQKRLDFTIDMPETLYIRSDKRRVQQVVMNLVSNAIKFTEKGGVHISVRTISSDKLQSVSEKTEAYDLKLITDYVEIIVKDTGIGIHKENIDKLFLAFSRIHIEGRPMQEGTGLGLYLSKKITDLLCGSITVESEFGKGSIFRLILPIRK